MKIIKRLVTLLVFLSVSLNIKLSWALNKITSVEVVDNVVVVDATEPIRFSIDNRDPFNVVVDIDDAELADPKGKHQTFKKGLISELRAVNSKTLPKKARIQMTLSTPVEVETIAKDNSLLIMLAQKDPAGPVNEGYPLTEPKRAQPKSDLTHVDTTKALQPATEIIALFVERTEKGSELVIKGNGAMPEPVVYSLDDSVIIEIDRLTMNAYIPKTMIEPIRGITTSTEKGVVRIKVEIEPDGSSPYLKQDKEFTKDVTLFEDEIRLLVERRPYVEEVKTGHIRELVDIDYSNADVKNVIQSIALRVGYGWIMDEDVSATVTLRQSNIQWREALRLLEKIADVQINIDDKTKTIRVQKSELSKLGISKKSDLISFDFQDADLSSVIMLLSEISGYNIIIHPEIKDIKYKVNTKLKNVSWQKSLDKIVKLLSLEYIVDDEDKIITIAPIETISKIEDARQKLRDARAKVYEAQSKLYTERAKIAAEKLKALMSEQKVTKIIKLKYISAYEAIKHITQLNIFRGVRSEVKTQQAGVTRQDVADIKITEAAIEAEVGITRIDSINAIVVRHVPTIVEEVERFIKSIDIPSQATQQVLIEARVVELTTSSAYDLGVQWGVSGWGATKDGGILSFGGTRAAKDTQSLSDYTTSPYSQVGIGQATQGTVGSANVMPLIINMPAAVAQGAGGSFGIGYINRAASLMLDFRLSALEKAGKGKILSQPKIMTLNNSAALIRHGARVPITTPGSTQGTYTTTYIDAALLMKVTPSIVFGSSENMIYIDLEISKDEPATSSDRKDILGNPQIDSRAATTRVLLKDGETIVIGGIRRETTGEGKNAVPYLSKIPILGSLFKKEERSHLTEELMIFVTPKIIQPIKQD